MANKELISEVISNDVFAQIERLLKYLDDAEKKLIETSKAALKMSNSLNTEKGFLAIQKAAERAYLAVEKVKKAEEQRSVIAARRAGIDQKNAQQAELHNRKIEDSDKRRAKQEETSLKRQEAARKKLEAQLKREQSEYFKLDKELTKIRARAQDVGAAMFRMEQAGRTAEPAYAKLQRRFENLSNITQLYDGRLKKIDATLGKHQRNVGNYGSAFDGLSNSINQLTREAPAFAVSFQTGILALSNNIPILADEINRLRAANQALATQGKATVPVWRQVVKSLVGWQTILSLTVTLVTIFAKDISEALKGMNMFRSSVDQATASNKAFNEALKSDEFKGAIREVIELNNAVKLYNDGLIRSEDVVKRYNDTIGQTAKEAKNLSDVEKFLAEDANNYIQMTLYKAAANIQLAKAAETAARIQEESTKGTSEFANIWDDLVATVKSGDILRIFSGQTISMNARYYQLLAQAGEQRKKALMTQLGDEREIYIQNAESLLAEAAKYANSLDIPLFGKTNEKTGKQQVDAELKLQQFREQVLADSARKIAEDEKRSFEEREKAATDYRTHMENVIGIEKEMALQTAESAAERLLAEEKYAAAIENLADEDKDIMLAILTDYFAEEDKIRMRAAQKRLDDIKENQTNELIALQMRFRDGLISQEKYEAERRKIQHKYLMDYIAEEIRGTEAIIELAKSKGQDTADAERRLAELKMKYSDEATKNYIDNLKKEQDEEKQRQELIKQIREELFELGATIFEAEFERENQRLEARLKAIDEQEKKEQRAIEVSALTNEEKANSQMALERRMDAERKRIEAQQRANQIRQARFEKAAAITKAAINTAVAITSVLPNFVLAALIGALGAVQIATIAAKPIPQYYKGTNSSNEGLAHVGERGSELMVTPDGQLALTPNTTTLTYLQKGTRIFTAQETAQILTKQTLPVSGFQHKELDIAPLIEAHKKSTSELKKAFGKQKTQVFTKHGLVSITKNGTKWSNYLRRRIK